MRVRFEDNGDVSVIAGTYSHGQGHATVYSQLVNEFLGVDYDKVKLIDGDTAIAPQMSNGTFGSRSSMVGGGGIRRASDIIIAKGKKIAGHLLQADANTVTFEAGVFKAGAGTMTIVEVAAAARDPKKLPDGVTPGLDEEVTYENDVENFPNGAHVVEVEIDPDTGVLEIVGYVAVDDCGVVLNPFIVHGQVYGGVAQGIGQALTEDVLYDEDGQLLTASYMDYGMPRASTMTHVEALFNVVPAKTNELGVKGAGEAGATGAPPAIVSAVCDALKPFGVRHLDMPLTPEKIWRAIGAGRTGKALDAARKKQSADQTEAEVTIEVALKVNGVERSAKVEARTLLAEMLRDHFAPHRHSCRGAIRRNAVAVSCISTARRSNPAPCWRCRRRAAR